MKNRYEILDAYVKFKESDEVQFMISTKDKCWRDIQNVSSGHKSKSYIKGGDVMAKNNNATSQHEIVLYQVDDTNVCVNVIYEHETFWLTQRGMSELFDCTTDNISLHLKNIYEEEELVKKSNYRVFLGSSNRKYK